MKVTLEDKTTVAIGLQELTDLIISNSQFYTNVMLAEQEEYLDCRLRVFEGNWELFTGDPQYDTDHRGYWSCASIPINCTRKEAKEIARELIEGLE